MKKLKNWFINLKIGKKISVGFTGVIAFIVIISSVSIYNMYQINKQSEEMYDQNLQAIEQMMTLKANLLDIKSNAILMLRTVNKPNVPKYEENITKIIAINNPILTNYPKMISSTEENQEFAQFMTIVGYYKPVRDNLIKAVKEGNYDAAEKIFPEFDNFTYQLQDKITKITEMNLKQAEETDAGNSKTFYTSLAITLFIVILTLIVSLSLSRYISKLININVKKILAFTDELAKGDLTQTLVIDTKDEFGLISQSLNDSNNNIKALISELINKITEISANSEQLSATIEEVSSKMDSINESSKQISESTVQLSANIQEVSSNVEQITHTANDFEKQSESTVHHAKEILTRATNIKEKGIKSKEDSAYVYNDKQEKIKKAIEEGEIVQEISKMTSMINDISSETHLLSLNAAIEASKAGEFGNGFNVIATQIRNLAQQSKETVETIQNLVTKVQKAFNNLSANAEDVLNYIDTTVKPDYVFLIESGEKYEKDSNFVNELSGDINKSTQVISNSINEVTGAIQSVSAISEETTSSTEEILGSINETTLAIEQIAKSALDQAQMAQELNEMVQKFKV